MKDIQTIARPYAKALFELALKHQMLTEWDQVLAILACAINDADMQKLLAHPEVSQAMLVDVLVDVVATYAVSKDVLEQVKSALQVMSVQKRLAVLPELARQYAMLKAEHEKMCSGTVFTSIQLEENQLHRLEAGLKKKLNKTVHLTQVVEPSLLGGARVQIGDMVIDGTLRGRLQRLSQALFA